MSISRGYKLNYSLLNYKSFQFKEEATQEESEQSIYKRGKSCQVIACIHMIVKPMHRTQAMEKSWQVYRSASKTYTCSIQIKFAPVLRTSYMQATKTDK